MGFVPLSWDVLTTSLRPAQHEPEDVEPGSHRVGSKKPAPEWTGSTRMAACSRGWMTLRKPSPGHKEVLELVSFCRRVPHAESHGWNLICLVRSFYGASDCLSPCPCATSGVASHWMLVATTAQLVLGQGCWAEGCMPWRAQQRICIDPGCRVTTNVMVRDTDLEVPNAADARRLEVVVDGLPLFGGVQLAVDTALVWCALFMRTVRARSDGVALVAARRRKKATYPELVGRRGRARLVVLVMEVGGRWSPETQSFVSLVASAKGRRESPLMRRHVEQAWRFRWGALLSC